MPRKLDAIVEKLLRKDPAERYASAGQLREDLESLDAPAARLPAKAAGRKWPWAVAALLLLLAGGLAWWKYRPVATPGAGGTAENANGEGPAGASPKAAKDSIILADFVNHTGDPVFDTTLNQALKIELEQSPVINIVSEQHLEQSVKFLGKPEGTPVTPEIAREIGEREGMKAILTGTIANLGKEYVISRTAQNTARGTKLSASRPALRTRSTCSMRWVPWLKR